MRFDQVWSVRYIIITVYTLIRVGNEGSLEMDLRDGGSKDREGGIIVYLGDSTSISIILEYFGGNGGDIGRVGNFYTPGMLRESVIQIYMV